MTLKDIIYTTECCHPAFFTLLIKCNSKATVISCNFIFNRLLNTTEIFIKDSMKQCTKDAEYNILSSFEILHYLTVFILTLKLVII